MLIYKMLGWCTPHSSIEDHVSHHNLVEHEIRVNKRRRYEYSREQISNEKKIRSSFLLVLNLTVIKSVKTGPRRLRKRLLASASRKRNTYGTQIVATNMNDQRLAYCFSYSTNIFLEATEHSQYKLVIDCLNFVSSAGMSLYSQQQKPKPQQSRPHKPHI